VTPPRRQRTTRHPQTLRIDAAATPRDLARAVALLERCEGTVMLGDALVLRPSPVVIRCEVLDPAPMAHRCAEEYKVLVENAARALEASALGNRLPRRSLEWVVVAVDNGDATEAWP